MAAKFGTASGRTYAVNVNGVDSDFFSRPEWRQFESRSKIKAFCDIAKTYHIRAKHRATLAAVKEWVKERKPSQFYASWISDSPTYKDDSVEVFFQES